MIGEIGVRKLGWVDLDFLFHTSDCPQQARVEKIGSF